jgi:guanine nucleotide-binding protein subunit alpha
MGNCGVKGDEEQAAKSKEIEKRLAQDKKMNKSVIKLLLLGAGDSGKST